VAVFTNLTQDHLDYHGSMDAYWAAKAALFDWPACRRRCQHRRPARRATGAARRARGLDVWTVSLHQPARLQAQDVRYGAHGLRWTLCEGAQTQVLDTALVGQYNVSNLLGVLAALRALGVPLADAARVCADLPAVPGRMERIGRPWAGRRWSWSTTPTRPTRWTRPWPRCARWPPSAAAACGACSAAAATATRQAPADGRGRAGRRRPRGGDQRQPALEPPQAIIDEILRGMRRAPRCWSNPTAPRHRHRGGAGRRARRGADCRQGPRGLPGRGRRQAPFSDQAQARQALDAWLAQGAAA
jgi:UDP-N-acetylmuramoyl-L-alanyl-D-glutamate--2,6-diaminopimelate ligase